MIPYSIAPPVSLYMYILAWSIEVKFELFNPIQYIGSLTWANSLQGYDYAEVQAGSNCFCNNDYDDRGKVTEAECNSACTGNGLQFCGGDKRNAIYTTVRTSE